METLDFGFFFCRVLHFYAMGYAEIMALPLSTFWLLHANIDRIKAHDDLRAVSMALVGQSTPDAVHEYRQRLVVEAGQIVTMATGSPLDVQRDEAGFQELRAMAGQW